MYTQLRHSVWRPGASLFVALVSLIVVTVAMPSTVAFGDAEVVPNEIIVVYDDDAVPTEQTDTQMEKRGYDVVEQIEPVSTQGTVAVANVPQGVSVEQAVSEVSALPGVEYAQPNYVYKAIEPAAAVNADDIDVNDSYYKQDKLKNLSLSNVFSAWELSQVNGSVSVAVLDTGCRLRHEDLTDNVDWTNAWDFIGTDSEGGQSLISSIEQDSSDYGDANGHGTHVCGIVAARANNDVGLAGVSYNAKVIPMRVLNASGSGTTDTVVSALNKVVSLKQSGVNVRVVNMSLGGSASDTQVDEAIARLASEGILCVCAAGNECSAGTHTPSDCPDSLSVMAVDANKQHTYYTNYKEGSDINTNKTVSAMGGGSASSTSDMVVSAYKNSDSSYAYMIGTSQATPLVSGVAALMFAANPSLSVPEVRSILSETADPIHTTGTYEYKDASSAGLVNAYNAVASAQGLSLTKVPEPQAIQGLTYAGVAQVGVVKGEAYTLSTVRDGESNVHEGAVGADVGVYVTTVHLKSGYQWDNGTRQDKVLRWSISPATLTVTCPSATVKVGDALPSDITIEGFVNGETQDTASGYVAPTIDYGGAAGEDRKAVLSAGEETHEYTCAASGGQAQNYVLEYVFGTIRVFAKTPVEIPQGRKLTYNGMEQDGVPENAAYVVTDGKQTNAGTYTSTLTLNTNDYVWADGTSEPKTIPWSIEKAKLKITMDNVAMWRKVDEITTENTETKLAEDKGELAAHLHVTGFVNGETPSTLRGFRLPDVCELVVDVGTDSLEQVVSTEDAGLISDGFEFRKITTDLMRNVGVKYLIPMVGMGGEDDGWDCGEPTSNYRFYEALSCTLRVYDKATPPTCTSCTYNGQNQVGVRGGTNCTVSGTTTSKNVGTYYASATPNTYCSWANDAPGNGTNTKNYAWSIGAKGIAGARVTLPSTSYTYTGMRIAPNPTVKLDGKTLVKGTDYTVSYENNTNAGTARVKVSGKGNYTGTVSATFTIRKATLTATYAGGTMTVGATAPTTVNVTGFMGGQKPATAAGYKAPRVSVSSAQRNTAGIYTLTPSGGSAANYNFVYRPGVLKVQVVAVSSVSLDRTSLSVHVGKAATLKATVKPNNATNKGVSWKSSNTSVATVNSQGVVTGVKPGTAQVTATAGGKSASCTVTVTTQVVAVSSVSLDRTSLSVHVGKAATLKATVNPNNATNKGVSWKSSNTSVATVNAAGVVTGVKPGTAQITVSAGGRSASCNVTVTTPGARVAYQTHVQNVGWQSWQRDGAMSGTSGRGLRLEGINIKLEGMPYGGNIEYRTHVQNIGWQGYVRNGAMSGTNGRGLRLEAIQIRLTGQMASLYDVWYRVHAQNVGWMGWARNDSPAGTAGYGYRLEGIEIRVLPKGSAAPGQMYEPFVSGNGSSPAQSFAGHGVRYQTHVQDVGWQNWVADGQMSGTQGMAKRLEGIQMNLADQSESGGIQYRTHVQNVGWQGWVSNGKMSGTSGRGLRLEAIQIALTGDMASRYDVWYRVHAQSFGWMGWAKNGAPSGTAGYGYRLESIEVLVLPKGAAAPGSTAGSFRSR